jgi:hypothetical protein
MGRLLGLLMTLISAVCVATLISQAVLIGAAVATGKLDRQKVSYILAVIQGIEPKPEKRDDKPEKKDPKAEQIAYEQVLEARAMKDRNLELREQALRNSLDQVRVDQNQFTSDRDDFLKMRQAFGEQLAAIEKRATEGGWDEVRRMLMAAKPKQAKEFLAAMLSRNELKEVVSLISPMADAKRAKIIAEFKTPDEIKKIEDVLRLIREGEPTSELAAGAQQKLNRNGQPNAQGTQ